MTIIKKLLNNSLRRKIAVIITPVAIILPLVLIIGFMTKQASSSDITFVNEWGIAGAGHGQFLSPYGIARDSSDNIYVVDNGNNRIQKFDNTGAYITQWGSSGTGNGQFDIPTGIAIDSLDYVYVTDSNNNRVEKFNSSGTYITKWGIQGAGDGQFQYPTGITVDSNGNIFVVDTNNNRIQKFDTIGNYITQWGSPGTGNGQLQSPYGIVADPWNNIYVTDSSNDRVEKFDNSGTYLSQWGTSGSGNGNFSNPTGITVDSLGNIFVVDSNNNQIQMFDSLGNYILQWGTFGTGESAFDYPGYIVIDSSGNVFVTDVNNNRVEKFTVASDLGPYISTANVNTYTGVSNVYALAKVGDTVYLGGGGGLEAINATDGSKITWDLGLPTVYSLAYSSTTNTLYAGTSTGITAIDTATSTGTLVDWTPNFQPAGTAAVYAFEVVNTTLYAGGVFDSADTQPRVNLAAFDISTSGGVLTSWTADTDAATAVYALKYANSKVYVGGNFNTIQGVSQPIIAAFDSTTGDVDTSFVPAFTLTNSPFVKTLEYYNGKVYVGGLFDTIDSTVFTNLAALDANTGAADTAWIPAPTYAVYALTVKDNYLYVGQSYQTQGFGGNVYGGAASSYNLTTGALTDWSPQDDQSINAMLAESNALYVGLLANVTSTYNIMEKNNFSLDNLFKLPVAYADIGGLIGTIYLAQFDIPATTPTPTPLPTSTPTPGPTSTPTPSPTSSSTVSAPVCSDTKPASPSNVTAVAGPGERQITLSWTAAADPVTDYSITYSDNSTSQKWGVVSTGKVTTYTISDLTIGTTYYFWVTAVNGCKPGDPIGPATIGGGAVSSSSGATTTSVSNVLYGTGSAGLGTVVSPLPPAGPVDLVKIGGLGIILVLIGGALLLAL